MKKKKKKKKKITLWTKTEKTPKANNNFNKDVKTL